MKNDVKVDIIKKNKKNNKQKKISVILEMQSHINVDTTKNKEEIS